ncbi:protein NCBP2AS2 homolog [Xylocopa sonorina]|uniref:protein NCBP2AS2 homolog n=1 Tax=Xylocopa sonorina TaxID=1818115 RepID=UPI00403B25CF
MGIIRILLTYLTQNEQLINKLADSKPIRRSAQFVAYLLMQSKQRNIYIFINREELIKKLETFSQKLKNKLEDVKSDIKKNQPK